MNALLDFDPQELARDRKTLRRSFAGSRLRDRWLAVHAGLFAPLSELTEARELQIIRICNRLADRIDKLNPYREVSATPRVIFPHMRREVKELTDCGVCL